MMRVRHNSRHLQTAAAHVAAYDASTPKRQPSLIALHTCSSTYLCGVHMSVTKRRSSWACIGNPNPEQETSKGTHAQETSANQRRPTTQHAAQGSNPPIGALYMQLAKIPHTHQTTPPATRAASADQHGTHRGRNRYHPSAHTTEDEALPCQTQCVPLRVIAFDMLTSGQRSYSR